MKAQTGESNANYWLMNREAKGSCACFAGVMTEIETSGVVFRQIKSPTKSADIFWGHLAYISHGVLSAGIHVAHNGCGGRPEPCRPEPLSRPHLWVKIVGWIVV